MADVSIQEDQAIPQQYEAKIPKTEQMGKVSYLKADIVHEAMNYGKNPTDGQVIMSKMLVDYKDLDPKSYSVAELKDMARPAGYAIAFAREPKMQGEDLGRNLFDKGMVVFSTALEHQGKTSFVAADKDGLFFIQKAEGRTDDQFFGAMREKFDQIGDQEERGAVKTNTDDEANARHWSTEMVKIVPIEPELAPDVLKLASEESLKDPFISEEDAKVARERFNKTEEKSTVSKPTINLKDIKF